MMRLHSDGKCLVSSDQFFESSESADTHSLFVFFFFVLFLFLFLFLSFVFCLSLSLSLFFFCSDELIYHLDNGHSSNKQKNKQKQTIQDLRPLCMRSENEIK